MILGAKWFLAGIILFSGNLVHCQQLFFERQDSIEVIDDTGEIMLNPWAGGINAAQVSKIDLDMDGREDLFVFDRDGNVVRTFLNIGSEGEVLYKHEWKYRDAFPIMTGWALLRDYNCDGKKDIFTYSQMGGGIDVYKNISQPETGPAFELAFSGVNTFYEFGSTQYEANLYVSSADIPAIFDFDNDGDLDIMTFTLGGSTLELHINHSIENFNTCDSLDFQLKNRCYGQFAEGSESNAITLDAPCSFNVVNPRGSDSDGGLRHVGSTIVAFDANADDLPEIVLGDVSFNNLTILYNHDNPDGETDSIASFETNFPFTEGGDIPVEIEVFPAGFYEDIDNDGINDFIATTNNQFTALNNHSMWYYKNNGSNNNPDFEFIQSNFLQSGMIEVGKGAYPIIFDANNDDLPDLLVSNYNYYLSAGNTISQIAYYENTGTPGSPVFTFVTDNYMNLASLGLGNGIHPSFADFDGDNDADLIFGDASGSVFLIINDAASGEPASFNPESMSILKDENNDEIDIGLYSTPQLFDLNNDGLPDLIIGERNGNINYYQNIGNVETPVFSYFTDTLGGLTTQDPLILVGNSAPLFYRIDGTTHLFIGTSSGNIHHYSGIDGNLDEDFTLESEFAFHINEGLSSKIFLADIDQDSLPELFVGNQSGGVSYWKGVSTQTSLFEAKGFNDLSVFPNPVKNVLNVILPENNAVFNFKIFDSMGKNVSTGELSTTTHVDISQLNQGLYIIILSSNNNHKEYRTKFIKK